MKLYGKQAPEVRRALINVVRLEQAAKRNEANSFKPFGFARAIEKAHGIGGGE